MRTLNSQLQMYGNLDCADDPAPGTRIETVTRDPVLPLGKAVFLFTVPYDVGDGSLQATDAAYAGTRLRLCYAFGSEHFTRTMARLYFLCGQEYRMSRVAVQ